MKRIPNQLIKDYLIVGSALVCILFLVHPTFLTPDQRAVPLPIFKIVQAAFFLLTLIISEFVATYILKNSFSYSCSITERLKHFALCAIVGVPLFNAFLNQSNTIMMFDFRSYSNAWSDTEGNFTLKWYMLTFDLCVIVAVIMIIAMMAFPFMVHIHRAFLVNINYITQVSGNSAGYKINLFSTDRILPVSKANVNLFREKIKELGKC